MEMQKISYATQAIARAVLRAPRLLLLDEATSALDAENEALVQASLDRLVGTLQARCSIVLVAHRLSTVMNASLILAMKAGRVVEQGTHEELLAADGVHAEHSLSPNGNRLQDFSGG